MTFRISLTFLAAALAAGQELAPRQAVQVASAMLARGDARGAERLLRSAVETLTAGGEEPSAATLHNLASAVHESGRYVEAEQFYKRALVAWDRLGAEGSAGRIRTLVNLGDTYKQQRRYARAEQVTLQAMQLLESTPTDPLNATVLNNLGAIYHGQQRFDLAVQYYRRSIATWELVIPSDRVRSAVGWNNIAAMYIDQDQLPEAEDALRRAMTIWEKALPEHHPLMSRALLNLAMLAVRQDRVQEADALFRRGLTVTRTALGDEHPLMGSTLAGYAGLLRTLKKDKEAKEMERQAQAIFDKHATENLAHHSIDQRQVVALQNRNQRR